MASCWKTLASGLSGLALAVTANASYAASPKPPGRAELVKELSACRAITDSTQRLACFDRTAAALDEAQSKGEVVVVDRKQVQEVKREAFGFNLSTLSVFNKSGGKEPEDDSMTAVAKSAFQNATGKWVVTLDSGAVWRQIDDDSLSREPHSGSQIHIRKAMMGSYMMNVDNQPGIRVHRDN
jgi:hypothetical protein